MALGRPWRLHCPLQKRPCRLAIPALRRKDFQRFAFVIHRPPQTKHLTTDLHEDLVQVPASLRQGAQSSRSLLPDLRGEQQPEPVPPEPHRLMADIDPSFMKQVLNLPQR